MESMRRRLRKFFPIMLIALTVQIFAPIAACWAASIAASDPLQAAFICHDSAGSAQGQAGGQSDQTGQHRAHDGCCSFCSVAHSGAPVDAPQTAVTTPYRDATRVAWLERSPVLSGSRPGSNAQARAPPALT
jgi:Protein of unknown function (DUF2946)